MMIEIFVIGSWILGWLYVRRSDRRNHNSAEYRKWGANLVKLRVLVSLWLVTILFGAFRLLVLADETVTALFLVVTVIAAASSVERKIWQLAVSLSDDGKVKGSLD